VSALDAAIAAKLAKAAEFLLGAEIMGDSAFDATVSLAVSAGINSSDVIMLKATGSFPTREQHDRAARLLDEAGFASAGRQLTRLLALKPSAQYSARRCTQNEAVQALQNARRLFDRAKQLNGRKV
jgi:hypothetical protein